MLRNYFVIALRLLIKNKTFSMINILGLSTGIACCILITLYIQDELNYEKGFADHERIYRINTAFIKDGVTENGGTTSPPIAWDLADALPEIETVTRVMPAPGIEAHIVTYGGNTFFEKEVLLVDSTFLEVFPYKLKEGNAATALDAPSTALISENLKKRIFGNKSPLDELLIINSGQSADTFRVTGVVERSTFPSHVDADIYMSMNSNGWGQWVLIQTTWANNNMVQSYLKLYDPAEAKVIESKIPAMLEAHAGEELRASGRQKHMTLQELDRIRLYSESTRRNISEASTGSITYVYIIATIGVFILLLACINFMNLTTAKSAQRAGEVGIRKSMGAFRSNLIKQFLGESMIIVGFALVFAFLFVALALPLFNDIMQKQLTLNSANMPFIVGAAAIICVVTGLIAGSYPAFFLSSLKPTQVLKGKSATDGSQWLRKGLVVFQFVITITLISSIVIIQKQLSFIQTKSLGFDTEQVIMVPLRTAQASEQYTAIKAEFEKIPGVNLVSATTSVPSTPLFRDWGVYKQGSTNDQSLRHEVISVDPDYFKTMKVELIEGRDFIADVDNQRNDTINPTKIIVNEASLAAFNIPLEKALGSVIYFEPGQERYEFTIIGVVKDFHQFSLHRKISPMIFMYPGERTRYPYLAASIDLARYNDIYPQMKKIWDQRVNEITFETVFLNENVKKMYAAEARTSTMLSISTTIALIISCLGLYGLSVYVAERKTKEIGIRKVVGASTESIVGMLSREYITLIIISFVIAIPPGYYFMNKWLESFAYKIEPGVMVFVLSGLVAFVIAWVTISFESFKAANKNPVDTFRTN